MNLETVMTEVAAQLDTITGLRAFAFPPDNVSPPAAFPLWPSTIEFDGTYLRGMDRVTLPVLVVVGRVSDRAAFKELAAYASGAGARSVKAVAELGSYTAFDMLRVTDVEFDVVTIAGVDYMAAEFHMDIAGSGS
jgi:hypothetical protein